MTDKQRTSERLSLARVWVRSNIITTVLIVFIALSLLLHAITIGALLRVRGVINQQLDVSLEQLAELRQQKVRYTFPVDQTVTVDTIVSLNETVSVPLSMTVPLSQTIVVPIDTPFGPFDLDVPLNFSVPVSDTVQIPINKDIPFKADVPIATDIPVDLDLSASPLGDIIRQFEDALRDLQNRL
jgi:hypothetical protein